MYEICIKYVECVRIKFYVDFTCVHTQDNMYFHLSCTISVVVLTFDRQETISDLPKKAVYISKVSRYVLYFFRIIKYCFVLIIINNYKQNFFWNYFIVLFLYILFY